MEYSRKYGHVSRIKKEVRKVSSAKARMLEDAEESRSFMKRMKSMGEMTGPMDTSTLTECGLERKLKKINLMRVCWRPNVSSLARGPLCETQSKTLGKWRESQR